MEISVSFTREELENASDLAILIADAATMVDGHLNHADLYQAVENTLTASADLAITGLSGTYKSISFDLISEASYKSEETYTLQIREHNGNSEEKD